MFRSFLILLLALVSAPVWASSNITITFSPSASMPAPANATLNIKAMPQGDYGITSVKVYENNALIHTTGEQDFSLLRSNRTVGSWTYKVEALDQLGATTSKTAILTVTSSAPPVVTLSGPTGVLNAPATATFTATASDSDGTIAKVEFVESGQVVRTFTAPQASYQHTFTGLAAGSHAISVLAYDNSGETSGKGMTLVVNGPPTVSIVGPTAGQVLQDGGNVVFTASASDPEDYFPQRVEFYVDGVQIGEDTYPSPDYSVTPHKFYFNHYQPVSPGAHTLVVKAVDANGLATSSVAQTFHVNAAPTVALTSPTAQFRYTSPASITLAATATDSDGIASVKFYVDGALVNTDTVAPFSYVYATSTTGNRTIEAVAIDTKGGVASTATSVNVAAVVQTSGTTLISRKYVYDDSQQLCKVIEPETGATVTQYDAAGNITWTASGLNLTDANTCDRDASYLSGRRVDRTYDPRHRVKTVTFPDGRGNLEYTYLLDGKVKAITTHNDGVGQNVVTTNYTYNRRGLLTREVMTFGAVVWPIDYGYTMDGHLASQTYHGLTIDYAPNALGQASKAGTYASGVAYYPNGAIKQFTYGNGIHHTMSQNSRGLPRVICDTVTVLAPGACNTGAFLFDTYSYDKNGNVTIIDDGRIAYGTTPGPTDRTMEYDGLDRLLSVVSPMYSAVPGSKATYAYDVVDNLTHVVAPGRDNYYCYDSAWRLTNLKSGAGCTGTTVMGLGYDVQGNLSNRNGRDYFFDYGNRLRSVEADTINGKPDSAYIYDGLGRRVRDYTGALGGKPAGNKYSQYSQAGQLLQASDARSGVFSEYVYLGGSLVAIRERTGAAGSYVYATKYQHTDALGTPAIVSSESRGVVELVKYEAYGKVLEPLPIKDGPGYTGHVLDAATGLNYMQQRYYDPSIGRFLSVDPVGVSGTTGTNFNRYWYGNNSPFLFKDPDGRQASSQSGVITVLSQQEKELQRQAESATAAGGYGSALTYKDPNVKGGGGSNDGFGARDTVLTMEQTFNIFEMSGYNLDGVEDSPEMRELGMRMFKTALERDKAMSRIEKIFRASSKPGTGIGSFVKRLISQARKEYLGTDAATVEQAYVETGGAIMAQVAAAYKPKFEEARSGFKPSY